MTTRPFLTCVICAVIIQSVAGCQSDSTHDPAAADVDASVLRRGNSGDPQTLDPSLAEDVHAFNVLRDLYEGLATEAADGSLIAGVAERWEISSDGLQYTFHLREDAIWSDGATVTADDFVAGFHRTLAPDSKSPYSFLLGSIRYYDAVTSGARPVTDIGVRAIDTHTLVIELATPANHFLGILAMPIAFPLYSGQKSDVRQFNDPEHFVGNGPYLLEEIQPGFRIRLKRNARFRNASNVSVPYVDYLPIEDPDTELNMYRAGELDITNTVPPAKIEALRRSRPDELSISPSLALYYLAFDMSEPPMHELMLRQALSMAIDRMALVKIIGRGEQAAFGIVPTGVAGHEAARYIWQSADRLDREAQSRQLYAEAGYSVSKPLEIALMYDVGDIHETVALAVSGMWRDVLGVEVALDKREWKYFLATRENRADWQIMRFSWFGDYNAATTFLDIFRSDSPQNLPGFRDSNYDELLDRAERTIDVRTKTQLMNEAEEMLLAAYPVVPLYFYVSKHLVSPAVKNFEKNILDIHPSQYLVKSIGEESARSRPR